MRGLREALTEAGISQKQMAEQLGISKGSMSLITGHGQFPKGRQAELIKEINAKLLAEGVSPEGIWKTVENEEENEEQEVCVVLTQSAKKQFRLFKDPFTDDVHDAQDVYLGSSSRYVAEYMYMTAKVGGMLAVIGESGSGKTTLRRLLIDRITAEEMKIKIIFPRTIDKGRLTAGSICDAIIADCSEQRPKRSLEAKARQIEKVLTASARSGWSHVLMIEEAHDLTIQTMKYLKRFWELEDGFKKLLSVILVAQPELKSKLDESRNWEAREIIRRMEVAEIAPLDAEQDLKEYLTLKFSRVDVKIDEVIDEGAYKAIIEKMTRKTRNGYRFSLAYPLSVNNLIKKALNVAADVGQERIDAETIQAL